MSASIKPPGGPGVVGVEGLGEVAPSAATHVGEAAGTGAAAPASVQSPSAALIAKLDAGEITREQAIDGMVAEALSALGAGKLPAAQRSELEGVLRAALADDPTLNRLLG
ncbi:MAG TPA: hypothetical protein VFX59_15745 [Polyangiales bacterium]|nr:hypothetical protein [Polyangiales bacterium]